MGFIHRKGQTLVEALIAVSILTVGFLGIVALLSKSFFISRATSDEVTATYLAAEGVELAKSIVDHDVYSGTWDACFGLALGQTKSYEFDYSVLASPGAACSSLNSDLFTGGGTPIEFSPATYSYGYKFPSAQRPIQTKFSREIRVSLPTASNGNEIVVRSIVRWPVWPLGAVVSQNITLEDHFYRWKP